MFSTAMSSCIRHSQGDLKMSFLMPKKETMDRRLTDLEQVVSVKTLFPLPLPSPLQT